MASDSDYLSYVLDLLRETKGISYRKMMGEYILYQDGVVFGGVYDNRFLVKKSQSLSAFHLKEQLPYPGGSMMLLVDSENPEIVKEIVETLRKELRK